MNAATSLRESSGKRGQTAIQVNKEAPETIPDFASGELVSTRTGDDDGNDGETTKLIAEDKRST